MSPCVLKSKRKTFPLERIPHGISILSMRNLYFVQCHHMCLKVESNRKTSPKQRERKNASFLSILCHFSFLLVICFVFAWSFFEVCFERSLSHTYIYINRTLTFLFSQMYNLFSFLFSLIKWVCIIFSFRSQRSVAYRLIEFIKWWIMGVFLFVLIALIYGNPWFLPSFLASKEENLA